MISRYQPGPSKRQRQQLRLRGPGACANPAAVRDGLSKYPELSQEDRHRHPEKPNTTPHWESPRYIQLSRPNPPCQHSLEPKSTPAHVTTYQLLSRLSRQGDVSSDASTPESTAPRRRNLKQHPAASLAITARTAEKRHAKPGRCLLEGTAPTVPGETPSQGEAACEALRDLITKARPRAVTPPAPQALPLLGRVLRPSNRVSLSLSLFPPPSTASPPPNSICNAPDPQ